RWEALTSAKAWSKEEAARAAFDLAVISVLLDAGAGPQWAYRDRENGLTVGRSEGLALASLTMFADGVFSGHPNDPLRADAAALIDLPADKLRRGLQISDANPLVGLDGRLGLLHRLGQAVADRPDLFGRRDTPRPGGLFDTLVAEAGGKSIRAP